MYRASPRYYYFGAGRDRPKWNMATRRARMGHLGAKEVRLGYRLLTIAQAFKLLGALNLQTSWSLHSHSFLTLAFTHPFLKFDIGIRELDNNLLLRSHTSQAGPSSTISACLSTCAFSSYISHCWVLCLRCRNPPPIGLARTPSQPKSQPVTLK